MVRTMPSNPWRCADFLERVRPGFAVSVTLHIGLFLLLAYWLAFRPVIEMPPADDPVFTVVEPPRPVPPPVAVKTTTEVKTITRRTIDHIHLNAPPPPPFPPNDDADQGTTASTGTAPAGPPVIINPTPIYRGSLAFPARAEDAGVSGYVDFDFTIEPDGTVGNPHMIAEVPAGYGFAAAAQKAFPKWRFEPMTKDGKPVAAQAQIRVSFKLQ